MKKKNDVLWFLAEISFADDEKFHIERVICRLYDILDGLTYLSENPGLFENDRILAMIKDDGDTYVYWKSKKDNKKPWEGFFKSANLEDDYDNCEALFPYMNEYVSCKESRKVYYQYGN